MSFLTHFDIFGRMNCCGAQWHSFYSAHLGLAPTGHLLPGGRSTAGPSYSRKSRERFYHNVAPILAVLKFGYNRLWLRLR
jgi:hypothetical protein